MFVPPEDLHSVGGRGGCDGPPLPGGWEEAFSVTYRLPYWHNRRTNAMPGEF